MNRRRMLLTLALAPALPLVGSGGSAGAADDPVVLRVEGDASAPQPSLRYGDGSPGPILRLQRGKATRISLRNGSSIPTSLDLHGIRTSPPLGGGGPLGRALAAGSEADVLLVPPDSGTFWFHPWILDRQRDTTAQGLAGVLVIEEPVPPDVDADWVAMLSDQPGSAVAAGAEALRIDGHAFARQETLRPGSRVRLRLVNASTRVALAATLSGALPSVVAIDGQPSELFRPRGETVPLGPGGRVDLLFDMPAHPGADIRLDVRATEPKPVTALLIRTEGAPRAARAPMAPLTPNPLLPRAIALEDATRATVSVATTPSGGIGTPLWAVNGVAGFDLPKKPLFTVRRGRPVTLTLTNTSQQLVAFRLHGFCMRLLHDLDDGWEPYWRDTILVQPGTSHHAAFLADLPGRWLIESPFFAQAAGGLRTWFEVM